MAAPTQMEGLLEKRSSDGSWKLQMFQLKGNFLFYSEPRPGAKSARLDLDDVTKLEIASRRSSSSSPASPRSPKGGGERKVLYLYIDATRRHRLRELENGGSPSIDDWLNALQEAKTRARRRNAPGDEGDDAPRGAAFEPAGRAPPAPPAFSLGLFFCACSE